ncbi:RDD family protein [Pseudoduganella sp. R-43]|uniref:RDD family protein n=1 Tax=unclassified Pseudoduganella TaxID=2637179 RepID=UPI003CF10DB9
MTFREHCQRLDTEALLGHLRLDLRDDAKAVVMQLLAARGVTPATIEQVLADQAARDADAFAESERMASLGERMLAFGIDFAAWLLAAACLLGTRDGETAALPASSFEVLSWTYLLLRDAGPGLSPGKRLLGLRVVRASDEGPISLLSSILRNATHLIFILDALFILGERRRRLGDKLARTIVLRAAAVGASIPPAACPPAQQNP